jgi:uncharacterized membrane protein
MKPPVKVPLPPEEINKNKRDKRVKKNRAAQRRFAKKLDFFEILGGIFCIIAFWGTRFLELDINGQVFCFAIAALVILLIVVILEWMKHILNLLIDIRQKLYENK